MKVWLYLKRTRKFETRYKRSNNIYNNIAIEIKNANSGINSKQDTEWIGPEYSFQIQGNKLFYKWTKCTENRLRGSVLVTYYYVTNYTQT